MQLQNDCEYYAQTFDKIEAEKQPFSAIVFENCHFQRCNFSAATFYKCKFIECNFIDSNLSNLSLDYSKFFDVSFTQSKLVGVDWTKADWPRFNTSAPMGFEECIINDSSFFGLALGELLLEQCKAHDADFRNGDFQQARFTYTDFAGSLFQQTNLQGADFSEAENYDIDLFNNNLKGARFSRYEAVRLLASLEIELVD